MVKIVAKYLFTGRGLIINNALLEYDEKSGQIISVDVAKQSDLTDYKFYDSAVVPGFVNAHCHVELSHLVDLFKQGTGMDGFIQQINSLRETVDAQGRIKALEEGMETLYNQGVSAMGDISNCSESFDCKSKSKIFTRTFLEVFGTEEVDAPGVIESVLELQKEALKYGINAAPTPHSCYTSHPKLIQMAAAEGLKSGYISYHSQESSQEEDMIRYGKGELSDDYNQRGCSVPKLNPDGALCYFLEILKPLVNIESGMIEENVILVHNVTTDQASIDAAKRVLKNSYWVTCPMSNIFIHRELPNLPLLAENDLNICIGTDSLSSNTHFSIVDEMKTIQNAFPQISMAQMIKWATINGAKAIGCDSQYGTIEVGKAPGLVFIDGVVEDQTGELRLTEQSKSVRII